MEDRIRDLFASRFGHPPARLVPLRQDGSERKLYRCSDGTLPSSGTVLAVFGPDPEENQAFLSFSRSLRTAGLPVPEIYASDEEAGIYLEEDLGDRTLHGARTAGGFEDSVVAAYKRVVELLPRLQIQGGRVIDYSVAHPRAEYDRTAMMWDLNYFKYCFLKPSGLPFHESHLEDDFARLCDFLLQADRSHFMHRDFQSRNIMLRGADEPWIIDYQGGRRGPLQYDLVKLLYEPSAAMPQTLRDELLGAYLAFLEQHIPVNPAAFVRHVPGFLLLRLLQGMGAYGYRGLLEGRAGFAASIPPAAMLLEQTMGGELHVELPELRMIAGRIFFNYH